ncbi:hypothetical protein [Pyxidicoccus xibeiensis]|uniref:hypothetical protein n=1 Tax=Pyxidicoccus xibeiensis TaxID=2906759 RepID=UPI0020A774C6|nr:hypothetical protein [Pyxidicoccus xibeiensis]MCP3143729.1 hypothetical protein [Pyxidicoccus xibeiensis]
MVCCIKKFPTTAAESCAATAVEVAEVLAGLQVLGETASAVTDGAPEEDEEDPDEGYRQHCIDMYVLCVHRKWTGDCHDCLRYCQGQKQWPFNICTRR